MLSCIWEWTTYITLNITYDWISHIETHNIDGGKRSTQRGVHTLPHTRRATGPADYGGGVGAAEGLDGVSRSIWPGEELCGLCITEASCCRYGKGGRLCVYVMKRESGEVCMQYLVTRGETDEHSYMCISNHHQWKKFECMHYSLKSALTWREGTTEICISGFY